MSKIVKHYPYYDLDQIWFQLIETEPNHSVNWKLINQLIITETETQK